MNNSTYQYRRDYNNHDKFNSENNNSYNNNYHYKDSYQKYDNRQNTQYSEKDNNHNYKNSNNWSLLKVYNKIPQHILLEYDGLINAHFKKKKTEETFFSLKASDYKINHNGKDIDPILLDNNKFSDIKNINKELINNLNYLGFNNLTAIQNVTIPLAIQGFDLIGCSDTGSGKTLAFLTPVISRLLDNKHKLLADKNNYNKGNITAPFILILSPTRELAEQINTEARKLIYKIGINSVAVYGGVSKYDQSNKLMFNTEILVGTPGRLIDMLKNNILSLSCVKCLILDEADEMLNMGFLPQVKEIINDYGLCSKENRQNLMFSATFESEVKNLASSFMNQYYFVSNGSGSNNNNNNVDLNDFDYNSLANSSSKWKIKENISQTIVPANNEEYKIDYIVNILIKDKNLSCIIFVDKKEKVDKIKNKLYYLKIPSTSIHGNKPQNLRQNAVNEFKEGKYRAIVATNILARGLDFVDVDYIFNFDMPTNIEDYIHRIGRTGRLGNEGHSVSFVERNEKFKKISRDLACYLTKCNKEVPKWLINMFSDYNKYSRDNNNNKDSYSSLVNGGKGEFINSNNNNNNNNSFYTFKHQNRINNENNFNNNIENKPNTLFDPNFGMYNFNHINGNLNNNCNNWNNNMYLNNMMNMAGNGFFNYNMSFNNNYDNNIAPSNNIDNNLNSKENNNMHINNLSTNNLTKGNDNINVNNTVSENNKVEDIKELSNKNKEDNENNRDNKYKEDNKDNNYKDDNSKSNNYDYSYRNLSKTTNSDHYKYSNKDLNRNNNDNNRHSNYEYTYKNNNYKRERSRSRSYSKKDKYNKNRRSYENKYYKDNRHSDSKYEYHNNRRDYDNNNNNNNRDYRYKKYNDKSNKDSFYRQDRDYHRERRDINSNSNKYINKKSEYTRDFNNDYKNRYEDKKYSHTSNTDNYQSKYNNNYDNEENNNKSNIENRNIWTD